MRGRVVTVDDLRRTLAIALTAFGAELAGLVGSALMLRVLYIYTEDTLGLVWAGLLGGLLQGVVLRGRTPLPLIALGWFVAWIPVECMITGFHFTHYSVLGFVVVPALATLAALSAYRIVVEKKIWYAIWYMLLILLFTVVVGEARTVFGLLPYDWQQFWLRVPY